LAVTWHVGVINVVTRQDVVDGGGSVTWRGVDGDVVCVVRPHPSMRGGATVDGR
jgi:hypothetical protein